MSVAAEPKADFRCSCGRTFAHDISLKRHCWVTGHTADESAPAAAEAAPVAASVQADAEATVVAPIQLPNVTSPNAVDEAMRILREKQQAQAAFETRQQRERQVKAALHSASVVVQNSVQMAAESGRQGVDFARQTLLFAFRLMLLLVVCGSLLLSGMGVGRMLATPAQAELAPAAQRQLAGFQGN